MAKSKNYHHFCPIARSLEVIGDKWSLLVVRDLLRGPQRFSDLLKYAGGITPKWLTARLRELEQAGIVERESKSGRREVWYHLTPKGRELAPVVQSLLVWGVHHALRPPLPGEAFHGDSAMAATVTYHNALGTRLPKAVEWEVRLDDEGPYTISFDGKRWRWREHSSERPDVTVAASHKDMASFLTTPRGQRDAHDLNLEGDPADVSLFVKTFGVADDGGVVGESFSGQGEAIAALYG